MSLMTADKATSSKRNKVIVIGAGIGGLATSIKLAKTGYDVTLFEKGPQAGGRCGQLMKEGHRFDLGATMMLMPGVYREVFDYLGIDIARSIRKDKLDILYKLYFDDGRELDFTTDSERMEQQLEQIEPGSYQRAKTYLKEGLEFYNDGMTHLVGRNFLNLFQFATLRNLALLFRLKVWVKHSSYVKRYFKNPHLQMAFMFQNIYVGQSPFQAPAFFSMIPAVELDEGSEFPKGGMYSVVERLLAEALDSGVNIRLDTPVRQICVTGRKADGIVLNSGEKIEADIIVSNADLPYTYRNLLPRGFMSWKLDRMKYSCSAIVFHWGLDKHYPQLEQHSVFLSDGFRGGLQKIFRDKSVDARPSFYVHAPSRTDISAAPEGGDTISVIVGAGHLDARKRQNWDALRDMSREAVLTRLSEAGITDMGDHIRFEVCYLPTAWESWLNISRGSVFGSLSHSLLQMGYFRPHNRHRRYRNLYFTGGSTHPGNGIPLVLLSAKLVTERILNDDKAQ